MAVNTVWYANFGNGTSTGYYAIAKWATTTAYTVGNIVRQNATPAVGSERVFICIIAGTSLGSEPTWVLTKGAKTAESGGPTWMECTGLPALNGDLTNTPLSSQNRSLAQALGNLITNNTQDHYFICTTAGTTGSGEPTYSTTTGATTVDSGCTWTCIGAVTSFTTIWAAAHARLQNALTLNWGNAAGNTTYVSASHAETQSSGTITWNAASGTSGPANVVCIANAPGSIPPTSSDITTGAGVTASGINMTIAQGLYIQGVTFTMAGASASTFNIGSTSIAANTYIRMDNCAIVWTNTTANQGQIGFSFGDTSSLVELNNTTMTLTGNAAVGFKPYGHIIWRNTPSAVSVHASMAKLFSFQGTGADILCEGVDFSGATTLSELVDGQPAPGRIVFSRCKFPSGVPMTVTTTIGGPIVDAINCDSGGNTYYHQHANGIGTHTSDATVIRTGGASDGTTGYSWQFNPTISTCSWTVPFESLPIVIWNSIPSTNRTVTLYGIWNNASLPTNTQIWMSVRYFGTASSTLATTQTTGTTNILAAGSNLPADSTSAWDSKISARLNSQSYTAGNIIKTASNPGRIFICTGSGSSAGSEPGGYATATDGTSVTDGTAHFRAAVRFSLTTTLSSPQPQTAGYFYVYIKTALASVSAINNIFWIDPLITLS